MNNTFLNSLTLKVIIVTFLLVSADIFGQDSLIIEKKYDNELKELVAKKSVENAFKYIEEIDTLTINNMITLTEIEAPPFKEMKRAEAFRTMLENAGADSVWIDGAGNVLARRHGKTRQRTIALDAHLDTVFPEGTDVTVRKKGDTLFAPGIGDDTRGLAMIITILKTLNQFNIETKSDIIFIGSVGEEGIGDLRGMKHIFKESSDLDIESWIFIDGGDIGRINNAALGSTRYKALFKGKGGHSWGAFGLANPHHALGFAISEFVTHAQKFTLTGPKTSFNIGRIGGGTSVNSIPFESWMEVDMRSVENKRLLKMDSIFKMSMNSGLERYNKSGIKDKVELELIKIGDRPSGEVPLEAELIQRSIAVTQFFGATPKLTIGSTNANIPISLGIPAVTIGRGGRGGGAHSLGEWYLNEDGAKAVKLAFLLVLAEAGFGE